MKLYLYDFDKTIYDGDSSVDFFFFCLKKKKSLIFQMIKLIPKAILYQFGKIDVTSFKNSIFSYYQKIDDIDSYLTEFWELNRHKIKDFYLEKDHSKDIIISASPYFSLKQICDELGVKDLIASDVDKKTGKFNKPNCRGEQKVIEFRKKYPKAKIMEMYSDSMHDKPLLELAEKSYYIVKNKIYDYRTYKPNIFKTMWIYASEFYKKKAEIINYIIVGVLTTIVSIASYALFLKAFANNYVIANILSWIAAVTFAYFTNRKYVFKSKNKKTKEATSFVLSRIVTLVLETVLLALLITGIRTNEIIAKVIAQIVVFISNYVISKILVFKKTTDK